MIRPMEERDIQRVYEIEAACFPDPWSRRSLAGELADPMACWLVLEKEGRVAAHMGIHLLGEEADVMNIAVAPEFRRQGLADRLMAAMLEKCRKQGVSRLMLEVRESNAPARALYEKWGFGEEGRRRRYYRDPVEDGILMSWWKGECEP